MSEIFSDDNRLVTLLAPDADLYGADPTTDYVSLENYEHLTAMIAHGVGATGTVVVTVLAASANDGTGATAIAFKYRKHTVVATQGAVTAATAAGFTIAAGSNQIAIIEVNADELPDGKPWVALDLNEGVDSPVDAAVIGILSKPRYAGPMVSPF